jgi:hypothetical protein
MLVLVSASSLRYLAKILHLQSSPSRRIERFPLFEFDQDDGLVLAPVLRYLDSIVVPLSTRVMQLSGSNWLALDYGNHMCRVEYLPFCANRDGDQKDSYGRIELETVEFCSAVLRGYTPINPSKGDVRIDEHGLDHVQCRGPGRKHNTTEIGISST